MSDSVTACLQFGSRARGDNDSASDNDICVIVRSLLSIDDVSRLKAESAERFTTSPDSVSIYTEDSMLVMAKIGSLFLWHLRLEGKILFDRDGYLRTLFRSHRPFRNHHLEWAEYDELLADVRSRLRTSGSANAFDYHLLQIIVRNTCILLTHLAGRVTFGRNSAFELASRLYDPFPVSREQYAILSTWHLRYARGVEQTPSPAIIRSPEALVEAASNLLMLLKDQLWMPSGSLEAWQSDYP